jgi:hypothetical protein
MRQRETNLSVSSQTSTLVDAKKHFKQKKKMCQQCINKRII